MSDMYLTTEGSTARMKLPRTEYLLLQLPRAEVAERVHASAARHQAERVWHVRVLWCMAAVMVVVAVLLVLRGYSTGLLALPIAGLIATLAQLLTHGGSGLRGHFHPASAVDCTGWLQQWQQELDLEYGAQHPQGPLTDERAAEYTRLVTHYHEAKDYMRQLEQAMQRLAAEHDLGFDQAERCDPDWGAPLPLGNTALFGLVTWLQQQGMKREAAVVIARAKSGQRPRLWLGHPATDADAAPDGEARTDA